MKEHIGNVELDLTYYPGEDFYSDGAIEDELLQYVKNHDTADYERFVSERKNWAVLYHLSPIRENIVSSLQCIKGKGVLEIGAGCGAVTGRLCDLAESVTCIELSKKRSMINAYRHKTCDNLKIMVGNFEKVEPNLKQQYDCITLIGVFEYAASYIDSSDPYHDFIRIIKRHLKPGGSLIIAIENRLGMKYFAGAKEDHVSIYFEGIEGYTNTKGVRTFSKEELENLLQEEGSTSCNFMYPYPDYKFPFSIYSDERLPEKGELNMNVLNMDQTRQLLFDESKAYDTLAGTELFPVFSNSFLLDVKFDE